MGMNDDDDDDSLTEVTRNPDGALLYTHGALDSRSEHQCHRNGALNVPLIDTLA